MSVSAPESTPEFSRPQALARLGAAPLVLDVTAGEAECAALAARFAIPAIGALTCRFILRRAPGEVVEASGHLDARVTQTCVVSLDDFETALSEDFTLRFVPAASLDEDEELDDLDGPDLIGHDGIAIDLGEAAAEQLALALDPWPRKPGAALPEMAAEPDPRLAPLAALRRLKPENNPD